MLLFLLFSLLLCAAPAAAQYKPITAVPDGSGISFVADGTPQCGYYLTADVDLDWMTSNVGLAPSTATSSYIIFAIDSVLFEPCVAAPSFSVRTPLAFSADAFLKPAVFWLAFDDNDAYTVEALAPARYSVANGVMTVAEHRFGMVVAVMPSEIVVPINATLTLPPMQLPWTFSFALGTLGAFSIARYAPTLCNQKTVALNVVSSLAYGQPLLDFLNDPAFVRSAASDVFELVYMTNDVDEPATISIGMTEATSTTRVAHLNPDTGVWSDMGGAADINAVSAAVPSIRGSWMLVDSVARVCAPGFFGSACARCPACSAGERCDDGFAGSGACMCAAQRINSLGVSGGPSAGGGCRCRRPLAWGADCSQTCDCSASLCSDQDGCRAASVNTALIVCLSVGLALVAAASIAAVWYWRSRIVAIFSATRRESHKELQMMTHVQPPSDA